MTHTPEDIRLAVLQVLRRTGWTHSALVLDMAAQVLADQTGDEAAAQEAVRAWAEGEA